MAQVAVCGAGLAGLLPALERRGHFGGRLHRLGAGDLRAALNFAVRTAAVTSSRAGADPLRADEVTD
ncbi:MAG: hypothetical protein ABIO67_03765 [Mycobacteriales bacterium]